MSDKELKEMNSELARVLEALIKACADFAKYRNRIENKELSSIDLVPHYLEK